MSHASSAEALLPISEGLCLLKKRLKRAKMKVSGQENVIKCDKNRKDNR